MTAEDIEKILGFIEAWMDEGLIDGGQLMTVRKMLQEALTQEEVTT